MAYDLALAQRIRTAVKGRRDVTEKEMFGGIAFMLDGNMFVGVMKPGFAKIASGGLMARVGADGEAAALAEPGTAAMAMAGRPMVGYVLVAPPAAATDRAVAAWVERSIAFVQTLPAKKKSSGAATKKAAAPAKPAPKKKPSSARSTPRRARSSVR